MIKFKKHQVKRWYTRISIDDKTGEEISRDDFTKENRPGYYQEMVDAGMENVEEAETEAEKLEREAKEQAKALESQKKTCITYLNESEIHVSNDPPYPEDVQAWKTARKQWRTILKSGILQPVPSKPFS